MDLGSNSRFPARPMDSGLETRVFISQIPICEVNLVWAIMVQNQHLQVSWAQGEIRQGPVNTFIIRDGLFHNVVSSPVVGEHFIEWLSVS